MDNESGRDDAATDGRTERSSRSPVEGETSGAPRSDASVIICAYTMDRWALLCDAVDSVLHQTAPPLEIILSIDHNDLLFDRCREHWPVESCEGSTPIRVVRNKYDGHLGSARTTAAEIAVGRYIAFLDDDAAAETDWLERILAPFADPSVIAVGGRPLPVYSKPRPRWFPYEYDWVFGCAYKGLPVETAPILHVIGAAMAVRRNDLEAIGYFHSDNHDDMDMCHRLLHHSPSSVILYEPNATVHHFVHENRLEWKYFWRRCFLVNRGKVRAFREMGEAQNLDAERRFAKRALTEGLRTGVHDLRHGDVGGLSRALVLCLGLTLAGLGYLTGACEWTLSNAWNRRFRGGRSVV